MASDEVQHQLQDVSLTASDSLGMFLMLTSLMSGLGGMQPSGRGSDGWLSMMIGMRNSGPSIKLFQWLLAITWSAIGLLTVRGWLPVVGFS